MFERHAFNRAFLRTCRRGYRRMSPEAGKLLAAALADNQTAGGLFRGRGDSGDVYYTFFGLLLAAATGCRIRRRQCANSLDTIDFATLDVVHGCAWLRARRLVKWLCFDGRKLAHLAGLPAASWPQQDASSPYSQFLLSTVDANYQATPLDAYRLPRHLFSSLRDHDDYGVNATAAALFLLPQAERGATADALRALQEPDGSFKATAAAPIGDLLSTATALFALQQCKKSPLYPAKSFLRDCFRADGLFAATPDDPTGDLEYTVYGLLAMGTMP